LTPGETLFVVLSYEAVPGLQNDIARMWINPDPSTFRDPLFDPTVTLPDVIDNTTGTGTDIGIASILLRQSPAPNATLDELRVGTTWAAVTIPEPATLGLVVIGWAISFSRRKSRRT
jgi:hypothetical protein